MVRLGQTPNEGRPAAGTPRRTATGVRLELVPRRPATAKYAARPAPRVTRELVTVLFLDVVDSTGHARALGDTRWLGLLGRYEAMARDEIRRAGGHTIVVVGDGLVATFRSAVQAVQCALRIAEASGAFGVQVRSGLHCGEIERCGARRGGIVFHATARLVSLAAPGEVLVSETLTQLAAGSTLSFQKRGRHVLRGFPGSWRLYGAADPSVGAAVPAAR